MLRHLRDEILSDGHRVLDLSRLKEAHVLAQATFVLPCSRDPSPLCPFLGDICCVFWCRSCAGQLTLTSMQPTAVTCFLLLCAINTPALLRTPPSSNDTQTYTHSDAECLDGLAPCGAVPEAGAGALQVQHEYGETGDLGLVAFNARATQRTMFPLPPLSIASVFQCARASNLPTTASP